MPVTYNLIASNTLSSSAASVTFSAIPGTYTDLVLRFAARNSNATTQAIHIITFNGLTTTIYSETNIKSENSPATAVSSRSTNDTDFATTSLNMPGASSTSNTFSSGELYIPSYTASQNKPVSFTIVREGNYTSADDANISTFAGLFRSTAAITSITIGAVTGNCVAGSSFFLYGIKNS